MKICFVVSQNSGTYRYTERLARDLTRYTDTIIVADISGKSKNSVRDKNKCSQKMNIVEVWKRNCFLTPMQILSTIKRYSCDIVIIQYEYSIFGKPIISHLILILVLGMLKLANIRTALVLHGVLHPKNLTKSDLLGIAIRGLLSLYYKKAYNSTDFVIVLNPLQKALLKSYGLSETKIKLIPHGVESCRNELGQKLVNNEEKVTTVLFHGFIRPTKGLLELMEAIKILEKRKLDIMLKILGSLPYRFYERLDEQEYLKKVIEKCKELGKKCILRVSSYTVDELLNEALSSDVIILPYTDNYIETSGVLHLFMDCEKPMIVSKVPRFISDVIPYEEVIAIKPSPEEIADALEKLIKDKELYATLVKNLKKKARKRYWIIIANELLKTLKDRIHGK